MTELQQQIDDEGFIVLQGALSASAVRAIQAEVQLALERGDEAVGPIRGDREVVAASRNLVQLWPGAIELAGRAAIRQTASDVLGPGCGLVRALYFDKPPGRSWSLPWHKDMTVAVRDNRLGGTHFSKPTTKAGVPHVEAPESVLERMLTARVHLDEVTAENGPLLVIPGSHRDGKASAPETAGFHAVLCAAGDVLLMRPLVSHCSRKSSAGTQRRRRVIHLEFAAKMTLPDGYEWREFHALR